MHHRDEAQRELIDRLTRDTEVALLAAAADRAPAVREWAVEHLAPSDGVFR